MAVAERDDAVLVTADEGVTHAEGIRCEVGSGDAQASALVLPVISTPDHLADLPPADALRGQVIRPAFPL